MKFMYPETLIFMLLPAFVLIFLLVTNKSNLERVFDKDALKRLKITTKSLTRAQRSGFLFFGLVLMIVALARPVIEGEKVTLESSGIEFAIAIDVSNSMKAKDIFPNRIKAAKEKAKLIIEQNMGANIALLVFSETPFLISPQSSDTSALLYFLDNLDVGMISSGGTNVSAAIESALSTLENADKKHLVLLSDGGDQKSFEKEIELAKKEGLHVHILNIGTQTGSPIEDKDGYMKDDGGNIAIVPFNREIKALASATGGVYAEFLFSKDDVNAITKVLSGLAKKESEQKEIVIYRELFYYPLGLAMILLFVALHSLPRKKSSSFFVLLFLMPLYLKAGMMDFQKLESAKEAYERGDFKESQKIYEELGKSSNEAHFNLGNSYYKQGEYQKALESWSKITTDKQALEAQKLYNIGNSEMMLKNYEKALEYYEKSLELKDDKDTKENMELAKKLVEKKEDKQEGGDKNQKNDKKSNENQQNKSAQNEQQKNQEPSKQERKEHGSVSDMEMKKWLDELDGQKKPTLMYDMPKSEDVNQKNKSRW